jgi:hypothetical protein
MTTGLNPGQKIFCWVPMLVRLRILAMEKGTHETEESCVRPRGVEPPSQEVQKSDPKNQGFSALQVVSFRNSLATRQESAGTFEYSRVPPLSRPARPDPR